MSVLIELPQSVEARVEEEARRFGVSAAQIIARVVGEKFAPALDVEEQKRRNAASVALLRGWLEQDEPSAPEELDLAEAEAKRFKRDLDAPREESGSRRLFPDADASGADESRDMV